MQTPKYLQREQTSQPLQKPFQSPSNPPANIIPLTLRTSMDRRRCLAILRSIKPRTDANREARVRAELQTSPQTIQKTMNGQTNERRKVEDYAANAGGENQANASDQNARYHRTPASDTPFEPRGAGGQQPRLAEVRKGRRRLECREGWSGAWWLRLRAFNQRGHSIRKTSTGPSPLPPISSQLYQLFSSARRRVVVRVKIVKCCPRSIKNRPVFVGNMF